MKLGMGAGMWVRGMGAIAVLWLGVSCQEGNDVQTRMDALDAKIASQPQVVLTLASWRGEDVGQMNHLLGAFTRSNPGISIRFEPILNTAYNEVLDAKLAAGSGPDLMYLRSYAQSRLLWQKGYLRDLSDRDVLKTGFSDEVRAAWTSGEGKTYGIPFIATSHGIFYNRRIFEKAGLGIPATWQELLSHARTLKKAGITPFANASGDGWTLAELLFMNVAPSFIGGRDGRMEYLSGKRKFDDPGMVSVFQAMADLAGFLPPLQSSLKYVDTENLFLGGKAAMLFGGSWEVTAFEAHKPDFEWGVFAVPPPAGKKSVVTFQLDAAVGINARTSHPKEALRFAEWLAGDSSAQLLVDELPGFYPLIKNPPEPSNRHAAEFLALSRDRATDIRLAWEGLMEGSPSAHTLIQQGVDGIINGRLSPLQAAADLRRGLDSWFVPDPARQE